LVRNRRRVQRQVLEVCARWVSAISQDCDARM